MRRSAFAITFVALGCLGGSACSTDEGDPRLGSSADAGAGASPESGPNESGGDAASSSDGAIGAPNPASRTGPAAPKNGTRIRLERWQTADGTDLAAGLFDTKLGVACSPRFLGDDQLHCVPETADLGQGPQWFADDQCTKPLARQSIACGARKYVARAAAATCSNTELYAVTSTFDGAEVSVELSGGSCSLGGNSSAVVHYAFDPTAPLSPDGFVRFTAEERDVASGVSVRVYVGDDGSVVPTADLIDKARGKDCTLGAADATGADVRCVPLARFIRSAIYFIDAACSVSLAGARSDGCQRTENYDSTVATEPEIAGCGASTPRAFTLGTSVVSSLYRSDPTCNGPLPVAGTLTSVGAEIPVEGLPKLTTTNIGGARIQHLGVVAESGAVPTTQLFDATTSLPCRLQVAGDGKMRCLPYANFVVGWFHDAGCTSPVASVPASCATSKYFTRPADEGCGKLTHVFALGAAVAPPDGKLYYGAPGSCGRYAVDADKRYFELGAEVSADTFAEATQKTL